MGSPKPSDKLEDWLSGVKKDSGTPIVWTFGLGLGMRLGFLSELICSKHHFLASKMNALESELTTICPAFVKRRPLYV